MMAIWSPKRNKSKTLCHFSWLNGSALFVFQSPRRRNIPQKSWQYTLNRLDGIGWIKSTVCNALTWHTLRDKSQINTGYISIASWLKWVVATFQLNSNHDLKPSHHKAILL
jgi:hypothetical protein